jgi:hypothetical protein
LSQTSSEV